ncbi:unnamed protein product [Polarella glacialis]|uniref:Uncharacterized protein n=1 Tax=Polarella glacialis TaxID=89957 RepID=A0A813DTN9_POLGL|nr:unnamed protein product [Polarella glacialis]
MLSRKNRRNGREPNTILCPWCKEVRGADWEHMVWKCEASGKPPELAAPTDLLQRRLGWASTARTRVYNFAVLDWMAEVRQRILEERYEHMSSAPKAKSTSKTAAAAKAASYRQTTMGAAATTAATATATAAATRQPQKRKAASQSSGMGASASGDQEALMSSSKKSKMSTLSKKRKMCEVLNGCPPLKKCRRSTTAAVPSGVVN